MIAYASALATLTRLDAAFLGEAHSSGLRGIARLHAKSMATLAHDMHDPAMEEQAAILDALLRSLDAPENAAVIAPARAPAASPVLPP